MGSIGNPKAWVPYVNSKDCSQGFCSLYCPQWCYIIFPPPPPLEFSDDSSSPSFSPLVIAIIGILASAFLLVSYYTIISKYCGNSSNSARATVNHDASDQESENNQNPSVHEPWHVATTGLDEALIKSITVCKYKKGDGLIEGTDCSVCLSEFEEDESVRLLPKCSHAFHVHCIDTWLKSHSNCPLCRANIFFISAAPPQLPPIAETPQNYQGSQQDSQGTSGNVAAAHDIERGASEEEIEQYDHGNGIPKTPLRAFSDLGNLQGRDTVIEITEEGYHQHIIRRSVSMDHSCRSQVSIADMLRMSQQGEIIQEEECRGGAGSSKQQAETAGRFTYRKKVLHCVRSPAVMKRSFSSGRFFLSRQGRVRSDTIMPL